MSRILLLRCLLRRIGQDQAGWRPIAKSVFTASGMKITADMLADISQDGNAMKAKIKLNIPWPCRSLTITANLARSNG